MKIIVFALLAMGLRDAAAHTDHDLVLPMYFLCEQTNNKLNGVTEHLLFSFEKPNPASSLNARGVLKRYVTSPPDENGHQFKAGFSEGVASIGSGEMPGYFSISGVGYWKTKDKIDDDLPNYVVGVWMTPDLSSISPMDRDPVFNFLNQYDASCKNVDKATAEKFNFL